ncbi:MAG: flagellar basal body rod C-terminal domain-containing protein [Syntrophaceae bacterium]
MSDAFNLALSALGSFLKKVDVTANNIANINTNNFKKSRADMEEAYPSGVKVSISQVNTPGDSLPPDEALSPSEKKQNQESSNVNLAEELVNLITTEHAVSANIKTITAEDEMQKTLIDIVA